MINDILDRIWSNMVKVEGGIIHSKNLDSFWINRYLVTEGEWLYIMGNSPNNFSVNPFELLDSEISEEEDPIEQDAQEEWISNFVENINECWEEMNRPVDAISSVDVDIFINNLNSLITGGRYRLPTDVEWEYAALGGQSFQEPIYRSRKYLERYVRMSHRKSWSKGSSTGSHQPVGQLKANYLGLYDMSGNVREWCTESSGDYKTISMMNQIGPHNKVSLVPRVLIWNFEREITDVSIPIEQPPSYLGISCGLRLVFEHDKPLDVSLPKGELISVLAGDIDRFVGELNVNLNQIEDAIPVTQIGVESNEVIQQGISIRWRNFECSVANLNVDHFRNGDPIPEARTNEAWIFANSNNLPAWCYYNNDPENGAVYGKLYNWYAVNDNRGLAPEGWRIPTDAEWTSLIDYLGGSMVAGDKMKSQEKWDYTPLYLGSGSGNNSSGFTGLPGGFRTFNGKFVSEGSRGCWWSATASSSDKAWSWLMYLGRVCLISHQQSISGVIPAGPNR